jgi:prolipoprotein diacylglyceryltransferase
MIAYAYPHNVVNEGSPIPDCRDEKFCRHLPIPVFPTPFYEIVMALLLFILLWALRKKFRIPGQLFAVYLIVNGAERFLIEKIRVNTKYESLPFQPTQAELISLLLILSGIILFIRLKKKNSATPAISSSQ